MTIRADIDHHHARRRRRRTAILATLGAVVVLTLLLGGVWIWRLALSDLPPTPDGPGLAIVNRPPSVIFIDRRGQEIGRRVPGGGEVLRIADLPSFVPQAFLAAEDRRFYSHFGVDLIGVARSVRTNLKARKVVEGGSTITQQIARTLFLTPDQTLRRKIQEAVLAVRIEQRMGKEDILKLYLNRIYFGAGAYGIEAASRTYFGKPARNLTLSEAVLLAALPKAPTRLDPTNNFSAALRRSRLVLARMEGEGWIDAATAAGARSSRPVLHLPAAEAAAELPLAPGSLLVIDDIQQLDADAQVALFRAFNAARFLGLALLLAGNEPPLRLALREDLRTRIGQTLIYEIQSLSDDEKSAALRRHAIERGMLMDPGVVHYLLRHGRRDLPSLMAMLNSLDRASLEQKRPPTLPLLRELMQTSLDLDKE